MWREDFETMRVESEDALMYGDSSLAGLEHTPFYVVAAGNAPLTMMSVDSTYHLFVFSSRRVR